MGKMERRQRVWLAALIALAVVAAACSGTAPPPGDSSAGTSETAMPGNTGAHDTAAILATLALDVGSPASTAAAIDRAEVARRTEAGLDAAIGAGAEGFVADIDAAQVQAFVDLATILEAMPPPTGWSHSTDLVASVGQGEASAPRTSESTSLSIGFAIALVAPAVGGLGGLGESSHSVSERLSPTTETSTHNGRTGTQTTNGGFAVDYSGGQLTLTVDTTTDTEIPADGARISSSVKVKIKLNPCPDPNGSVRIEGEISAGDSFSGGTGAGTGLDSTTKFVAIVTVNEGAEIQDIMVEVDQDQQIRGGVNGDSSYGTSLRFPTDTGGSIAFTGPRSSVTAVRGTPTVNQTAGSLLLGAFLSSQFASDAAEASKKVWQDGSCVAIDVTPHGGAAAVGAKVDITAELRHKVTAEQLEKKVKGTLAGEAALEPNGTDQDAPADLAYTASSTAGKTGTITFRSVSNRGIGKETVVFTAGTSSWKLSVDGVASGQQLQLIYTLSVKAKDVVLELGPDGNVTGNGTVVIDGPLEMPGSGCTGTYHANEALEVTGRLIPAEDGEVPDLHLDFWFPPGTGDMVVNCPQTPPIVLAGGGSGISTQWGEAIGEVDFRACPGKDTVPVQGEFDRGPLGVLHASGTISVEPIGTCEALYGTE